MKNMKKILILALILSALLCMNVFAAEIGTITDPVTGNPIAAEKATILEKEVAGEQQKVAVKFTQSGVTKDNMYLVLILAADANGEAPLRPTDSNILYVNQATAESDTITFDNLYPSEVKESYIFLAGADVDYSKPLAKINPLKPAGMEVSGNVTSYLTGDATVQLFKGENLIATDTGATYLFEAVEAGTYTLKVSKNNHVTREYEVTVANSAVVQDVKICPVGDVTGDGRILINDVNALYQHFRRSKLLSGYELSCGDVVIVDGKVLINEVNALYSHFRNAKSLWK